MNVSPEISEPSRHLYLLKKDAGENRMTGELDEPGAAAGGDQHARIPDAILYCVDLPVGARLLYGALQRHMGLKGCFPSMRTLAGELGVSFRSVENWLQALIARGAVAVTEQGGGRRSNRYDLTGQVRSVATDATKASVAPDATQGGDAARSVAPDAKQRSTRCLAAKHQMLQSHSHVTKENITIDSAPTERAAPGQKPAPSKAVGTPGQPAPTVEATPTEQERVPRAKRASADAKPAAEVPATPREPTPIQRVEQGIKAAGVRVAMNWGPDGKSLATLLSGSDVTVEDVVGCFIDIMTSRYGDAFMRRGLTVTLVCTRYISGWLNWKESGEKGERNPDHGGTGGAARARAGDHRQPANPQHAAHAAKLDW